VQTSSDVPAAESAPMITRSSSSTEMIKDMMDPFRGWFGRSWIGNLWPATDARLCTE
jgi:hypothetical protein